MYPTSDFQGGWRPPSGPFSAPPPPPPPSQPPRPPYYPRGPPPPNRHRFPGASGRFPVPGPRPMGWFPPPGVPPPSVRFSQNCSTPPPSWQAGGAAAEGQTTGPTQHRSLSAPPPLQPPGGRGDTHGGGPRTDERFHWRRNKSRAESGPNLRTDHISEEGEERRREARSGSEGGPPRWEDGRRARWEDSGRLRRESDGRSRRADDRWKDDSGRSGRESNSRSERSGQQNDARPGSESSSERVDSRSRDDERVGERVDGRSQGAERVGERVESRSRGDDRAGSERSDGSRPRQREEGSRRFPDRSEAGRTRRSESVRSNKEGRASRADSDRERRSRHDDDRPRGNRRERKRRRPDDTGSESDASERRGSSQRDRRDGERSRAQRPRKAPDPAADTTSAQDLVSEEAMTDRDKRFAEEERLMREKQDMISKALEDEKLIWTRSSPADPFYQRHSDNLNLMVATKLTVEQCDRFRTELVERKSRTCAELPPVCLTPITAKRHVHNCGGSDSDDTSSDSSESEDETMLVHEELERKSRHPYRLHTELWYNDCGKMNVGDVCRCSIKARQAGIRHNIYAGEEPVPRCDPHTNNVDRLYHYRVLICPPTNFLVSRPTSIMHDGHEFIFEGLSLLSHYRLTELPPCHIIRFNIEYTVLYMEEKLPDNFVMEEVDLFTNFLYESLLEMVDLDLFPHADKDRTGCPMFHIMPRFVRDLANNGKEILALNEVLSYLLANDGPLVEKEELEEVTKMQQWDWQNRADAVRGMLVTHPARKPSCIRLDQLDREVLPKDKDEKEEDKDKEEVEYHFPEIVHFGIRPPQLSYAGNPEYQKAWREYVKYRHLLANLPKPTMDDKRKLAARESQLQALRLQANLKRDVTVAVSCEGFRRTGLMADVVQHALFLPVLVCHLRFHKSLNVLEKTIDYEFRNRSLLQLALTHPSYRENHGTNRDHSRNSLSNCGIRQPEYGDRCINYTATRKRGLNILINIMSQFGKKEATESRITHNERLEFLGDAVVEFLTSIHLFFMFPNLEEGGLATYRAAIVQNQHLAVLARSLGLHEFLLYGHGSDLCHDLELRHAMANCFEALMGALFLDSGIEVADKVFSRTLFMDNEQLLHIWQHYPPHPLQEQEPQGDRKWIEKFPRLQQMQEFEGLIGVEFMHIRLLARAFTDRSIGFNNLTLGSNQRLEFLGDTVLQLIASEYLYRHFPEHHEGHLSLLRSSLVNNRTQAVVCTDLGMTQYAAYSHLKTEIKMKDRADLLEALIGALYVDKGLEFCRKFCEVCFFPRLQLFILNQDWNDPKSKLQQCCLTLRNMDSSEPDIPIYKVIECLGPTNTRVYSVAVYFQGKRLAKASGHSIQMAEMNAASQALENCKPLFPQLDHQHRVIAKSIRIQTKKLEEHFGADVTKGSAMVYQMR